METTLHKSSELQKPQNFDKYAQSGDYHWQESTPSIKTTFNPWLHARYEMAKAAVRQVARTKSGKAVDLGCGDGYLTHFLAQSGFQTTGIDGMNAAIEIAKSKIPAELKTTLGFKTGSVFETGLPSQSADLVVSFDVIEHLDDMPKFMEEIKRLVKPDGVVIIGTPIRYKEIPIDPFHVKEFFQDEFLKFFESYFNVSKKTYALPLELLFLMRRKFKIFGVRKNWAWNFINLYVVLTGKNPFSEENSELPSYQLLIGTNKG